MNWGIWCHASFMYVFLDWHFGGLNSCARHVLVVWLMKAKKTIMLLVATMVAITLSCCERDSTGTGGDILPAGYVDLGLPSGTKWKSANETGFFSYGVAIDNFGSGLPTKEQFEELISQCQRTWVGNDHCDLMLTGPSGKSITLSYVGDGFYWSSTPSGTDRAWLLWFNSGEVHTGTFERSRKFSVRLVQN